MVKKLSLKSWDNLATIGFQKKILSTETVENRGDKMDKYERYAVSHYLSQWPEELTETHPNATGFDVIIEALQNDDESLDIIVCETYELYTGEDVAALIMEMNDSLRRVFL